MLVIAIAYCHRAPLLGYLLTTMPGYWGFSLFGLYLRHLRYDELAGAIKVGGRLGNSEQQGRLFGFFETGRDYCRYHCRFFCHGGFHWFGSSLLGF